MRRALAEMTRKEFGRLLRERFPSFKEAQGLEIPAGCRVYECKSSCSLAVYVALIVAPKTEEFTIDVAWSETAQYPAKWGGLSLPTDKPRGGSMRFRISRLSSPRPQEDWWWALGGKPSVSETVDFDTIEGNRLSTDEMLRDIAPSVNDAISKIESHAVPYFRKVATEHGCTLPL